MGTPSKTIIDWINYILKHKGWTGTDLARQSGLAPSTILRLLNDPDHPFVPTLRTLQKIANAAGMRVPRRIADTIDSETAEEVPNRTDVRRPALDDRPAEVPLKNISSLPASLRSSLNLHREIYVPMPPQLSSDGTCFAFHMPDNIFAPLMKSGDLMFASNRRDPTNGDLILLTDQAGRSRVRVLMNINEDGLTLSKSMPPKDDERVPFDDIQEIAIVSASFRS